MATIVFTSPTSGTASMDRIVHVVGRGAEFFRVNKKASLKPGDDVFHLDPDADHIYWFQGPKFWNPEISLAQFKVIAHFRDPRDLACNQYWWALQHPNTHDTPEAAEALRKRTEEEGIDAFVVQRKYDDLYSVYRQIDRQCGGAVYTSYTQLCSAFDYMVLNLCKLFGKDPRVILNKLQIERPENLGGNKNWTKIGTVWQGSDIAPGRFRRELTPETQTALTKRLAKELEFCRSKEPEFLQPHYY